MGQREDASASRTQARPHKPAAPLESGTRLVSLDAFRGLTIAGMLLVNNIALDTRTPAQLTHAPWNGGVRFADLIFPWFLLMAGVAIPFSAAGAKAKGLALWRYDLKVLGRVLALVFLGCLIDSSLAKQPLFDLNVLQLIGLAYGVASLLYALPLPRRLAVAFGLLVLHGAAIKWLPVPGIGAGAFRADANLIAHLNQTYLQPVHLDGLISVVPTSALVLIGSAFGDLLRWEVRPLPKNPAADPGKRGASGPGLGMALQPAVQQAGMDGFVYSADGGAGRFPADRAVHAGRRHGLARSARGLCSR